MGSEAVSIKEYIRIAIIATELRTRGLFKKLCSFATMIQPGPKR
nr:MAG TPA: hypothetical protein [Caudoviricetes sp.]